MVAARSSVFAFCDQISDPSPERLRLALHQVQVQSKESVRDCVVVLARLHPPSTDSVEVLEDAYQVDCARTQSQSKESKHH